MVSYVFLAILTSFYLVCVTKSDPYYNMCGDDSWIKYEDTKCFKLIDQLVSRQQADALCRQYIGSTKPLIPPLLNVKSEKEQTFLTNAIFNLSLVVDNVWLGARRVNNSQIFAWDDERIVEYSNWAIGTPSTQSEKQCTQMTSRLSRSEESVSSEDGKWNDVSCERRNVVVCQKMQAWSAVQLQDAILNLRDELIKTKEELSQTNINLWQTKSDLEIAKSDLSSLERNPVPIGFIYVELPTQPDPRTLWSNIRWEDVTSSYAGLFFRAAGGNAAPFNQTQIENSHRLIQVRANKLTSFDHSIFEPVDIPANGAFSANVVSGSLAPSIGTPGALAMKFRLNSGEVRPKNTATRIWKRVQ